MSSDVKWIKLAVDMFEDEKIDFISSLPDADSILVVWVRILTMAGKCNAGGFIMLTENIPYTDDMLAHKFHKPINLVRLALQTFVRLGMIVEDDGKIGLVNWEKHQNADGLEKIREQTRIRGSNFRERQRVKAVLSAPPAPTPAPALPAPDPSSNVTQTVENNVSITQPSISSSISPSSSSPPQEKVKKTREERHICGSQKNVLLSDSQRSRLEEEFGVEFIAGLIEFYSSYKAEKDYKSKDDNLSIRRWVVDAYRRRSIEGGGKLRIHSQNTCLDMQEG